MAERLNANVRDSDVVGRMGGDEFAVVLVQADQATAEAKAAILAEAIERDLGVPGDGARLQVLRGARDQPPTSTPRP